MQPATLMSQGWTCAGRDRLTQGDQGHRPQQGDGHPRLTNGSPARVFHQGPLQRAASMTVCSFAVRIPCSHRNEALAQKVKRIRSIQKCIPRSIAARCITAGKAFDFWGEALVGQGKRPAECGSAELDPKAKRERPALDKGAAHEKALDHGSGAALQE